MTTEEARIRDDERRRCEAWLRAKAFEEAAKGDNPDPDVWRHFLTLSWALKRVADELGVLTELPEVPPCP